MPSTMPFPVLSFSETAGTVVARPHEEEEVSPAVAVAQEMAMAAAREIA